MIKKWITFASLLIAGINACAQCTVPKNLPGKEVLAEVTGPYAPDNPMSGQIYQMHFHSDGKYDYSVLNDGTSVSGTYTYNVIAKNIAVIKATAMFNNIPVEYTMTLICTNPNSGYYIYQQTEGMNGVRSNVSRYFFIN